jgi:hypothetical protein
MSEQKTVEQKLVYGTGTGLLLHSGKRAVISAVLTMGRFRVVTKTGIIHVSTLDVERLLTQEETLAALKEFNK